MIDSQNQTYVNAKSYDFQHETSKEINKIMKDINPKKQLVLIRANYQIIKLSAYIIYSHFTNSHFTNTHY